MVQEPFSTFHPSIDLLLKRNGIELWIQREDQMDALVSGNKIYKLKKHLEQMRAQEKHRILTFGGAYSNHIAATAAVCSALCIKAIGVIRGERPAQLNPTLRRAEEKGMLLHFVSRGDYRQKEEKAFLLRLREQFDDPYMIPEGGGDLLGVEGARGMVHSETRAFDVIVVATGTGTTAAGIALEAEVHQRIIGIPIHKHTAVLSELIGRYPELEAISDRVDIQHYHFGGYAKWDVEHVDFIRSFFDRYGVPLDPVYTAKAMRGTLELIDADTFKPGSRVLFVHTGGLQAVEGFEERHGLQLFPTSL